MRSPAVRLYALFSGYFATTGHQPPTCGKRYRHPVDDVKNMRPRKSVFVWRIHAHVVDMWGPPRPKVHGCEHSASQDQVQDANDAFGEPRRLSILAVFSASIGVLVAAS